MFLLAIGLAFGGCYELPFSNPNLSDGWGSTCCGRTNPHRGVDFPQAAGTPIPAVSNGRVVVNQWSNCLGNVVVVEHPDGWFSGYAHLQSASPLAVGTLVTIGDAVGAVGNTGSCSNGAHLHLTMADHVDGWYTGTTVDPYTFITSRGPEPETCNGEDDDCNGLIDDATTCELDYLHVTAPVYARPSTTDVDGDGKADTCALETDGFRCWPAREASWDAPWTPVAWTSAAGWDAPERFATLRMGDLDANGFADVCGWDGQDMVCALSDGAGFGLPTVWRSGLTAEAGFSDPARYTSLRLADVNGDGGDDLCLLEAQGLRCYLSNGRAFETSFEGPPWAAAEQSGATYYGTLRTGDLDGDGRADVCLRRADGVDCHLSTAQGFATTPIEIDWSDSRGFSPFHYWSTFRLADVDGDGKQEPCVRSSAGFRCGLSDGASFASPSSIVAPLSNDRGWSDPSNFHTIRVEDVDGDGSFDVCARGDAGLYCWTWDGSNTTQIAGPTWSDAQGWTAPSYMHSIRLADATGDGLADACGRGSQGWRCIPSQGTGFSGQFVLSGLTNADGADAPAVYGSIWSGGRSCGTRDAPPCTRAFEDSGGDSGDSGGNGDSDRPVDSDSGGGGGDAPAEPGCGCGHGSGGSRAMWLVALGAVSWRRRRMVPRRPRG
ncbi:MAG: hypothetical protein EP330_25920 [Deltaproteobacteria bacterium]|nr:MAG: hypothetical protein EP330_25920 [Deltaproteobacteria bacterium]